ncbi:MAG: NAD(P)-dependent glycerol-3-phosphate dehydrogenase [Chloroflexota bacterium]|nr:NAD(P)-dependent glycerol-3-phosphate dehydrogenase [Chloroflexota bacterium]
MAVTQARYRKVILLCRSAEERAHLDADGSNERFLPGARFPPALQLEHEAHRACEGAALIVLVVPSSRMRKNVRWVAGSLTPRHVVLSGAKGFEPGTFKRMTEVLEEELAPTGVRSIGALSGPNLAREIADGKPATSVVASRSEEALVAALQCLNTPLLRVYANTDVTGVELAGALKNIVAIGAGAIDGLQAGDNAKAAFVTRGLAEIARLGVASGANPLTFAGLAGLGDLLATVSSPGSRNRYVGQEFARGRSLEEIRADLSPQVAEGIDTTRAVYHLSHERDVRMPIVEQTYQVLFEGKPVSQAVSDLMLRDPKHELEF